MNIVNEEGWINETTFSVAAYGSPEDAISTQGSRKERSRQAALRNARKKIVAQFILEKKKLFSNQQHSEVAAAQKKYDTGNLNEVLMNGNVLQIQFDDEENCELIYVVQGPTLIQLIKGADFNKIECNK